MSIQIAAFTEVHIPDILNACHNWQELSAYGPPYWRPRSSAELQRKIAATSGPHPSSEYNFVILSGTRLVGECSLHAIDWRNRHAQVGICIWDLADRGQGHGSAAASLLIQWARDDLNLHRLEAWILADNTASRHTFAALGFAHEGTFKERYFHNGTHKSVHIYGRLLHQTGREDTAPPFRETD